MTDRHHPDPTEHEQLTEQDLAIATLVGRYVDTTAENFARTLMISCYSFTAIAQRAEKLMPQGGSLLTLTYYGAEKWMPHYNVMGIAKAALEASVRYLAADLGEREAQPELARRRRELDGLHHQAADRASRAGPAQGTGGHELAETADRAVHRQHGISERGVSGLARRVEPLHERREGQSGMPEPGPDGAMRAP